MKRVYALSVLGLLLLAGELFGLSILNSGDATQYFFVSERTPREILSTIADQRELEEFVQTNMFRMRYVPPDSVRTAVSVPAEGGALVVLHVVPGASEYTVTLHPLTGRMEEIVPRSDGEERVAEVQALDIRLPREVIRIDNRYVDWENLQPLAAFSDATAPRQVKVERPDETSTRAIDESLVWPRAGTRLDEVKAVRGDAALYLYLAAEREFGEGTSIFLYAYESRDASRSRFTMEIPVGAATNAVLLWQAGSEEPEVVGDFARAGFLLEARIFLNRLPGGLSFVERDSASIDLATSYALPGRFEEFFHTTIYLDNVPHRGAGM